MSSRGDILRLKSWKTYGSNGKNWAGYKAHPGSVLVACVLGSEPLAMREDSEALDTDRALNEMGWVLESVADKTCTELEEKFAAQAAELQALRTELTQAYADYQQEIDWRAEADDQVQALRAQVAALRSAFLRYIEWHGPSSDHDLDDAPDDGREVDRQVNAALATTPDEALRVVRRLSAGFREVAGRDWRNLTEEQQRPCLEAERLFGPGGDR